MTEITILVYPHCVLEPNIQPEFASGRLAIQFVLMRLDEKHLESNKSFTHESVLQETLWECNLIFSITLHIFLWWMIYSWVTKSQWRSLCFLKFTVTTCEQVLTHTAIMCVHILSSSLDRGFLLVFYSHLHLFTPQSDPNNKSILRTHIFFLLIARHMSHVSALADGGLLQELKTCCFYWQKAFEQNYFL